MRGWIRKHRQGFVVVILGFSLVASGLLVAVLLAYRTYEHVKDPLHSAQVTLTALAHSPDTLNSALGRNLTEIRLAMASKEVAEAESEIKSSVGLRILGLIPGLHSQRVGLDQLVSDLHETTATSVALLHSVSALAAHSHGTNISLPDLKSLGTEMGMAKDQLASEYRSASGLWGPIGADRQKFDQEDRRAVRLLGQGVDLAKYALPFLGADGPRTYLVMGENNAEMRDQGATLSYSLMRTSDGTISLTNGGTVNDIELSSPAAGDPVPTGTQAAFGELAPTETWQSTNATADFTFSGRDMQAMFASVKGMHVDGVMGIDVDALQGLLALTGPVSVPGISEPVTSQNAASILLSQLYQGLSPESPQGPRREELADVTSATVHQLQTGNVDLVALARTLATEVAGRHLLLWDENPTYERTIREVGASGAVDTNDPNRTFHVAVENATATKLDYFVDVAIADTVYLNPNGSAVVDTSVKVVNHAPAGQPPSYQLGPDGMNSSIPGEYIGRVLVWSPRGSSVVGGINESGLVVHEEDLPALAGHTAISQFSTTIPHAVRDGRLSLVFVPQPRLTPETVSVDVASSGLKPGSSSVKRASLTQSRTFTWYFSGNTG